jgi:flagellar basal body P-ring protein FlgI
MEHGGKALVTLGRGVLQFNRDVQMQTSANVVTNGPNGTQILEGDVVITAIPPAGKQHLVRVFKTPDGEKREESYAQPQTMTLKAQKVTVTPTPEGGVILEFEGGSVEHH